MLACLVFSTPFVQIRMAFSPVIIFIIISNTCLCSTIESYHQKYVIIHTTYSQTSLSETITYAILMIGAMWMTPNQLQRLQRYGQVLFLDGNGRIKQVFKCCRMINCPFLFIVSLLMSPRFSLFPYVLNSCRMTSPCLPQPSLMRTARYGPLPLP